MKSFFTSIIFLMLLLNITDAQNSMVGDGFGGRLWYSPTNYTVGSYSAYSICYDDSSQLYGWGGNGTNQLGLGSSIWGVNVPTPIPNMTNVKYFSTGYNMGAIKNDNSGWIWGSTTNPVQVITNAYFLDASSYNISFIKTDGTVWSLGDNTFGQFGDGTTTTPSSSLTVPTQMLNITNAVRVANNSTTTIVLLADSTLVSCGDNSFGFGNLGLGSSIQSTTIPLPIIGLPKIVDIKSNAEGTIALTANGDVYSWGIDYSTVYSNLSYNYTPVLLPNLTDIIAISGCDDGYHFLALDVNGNCYGWGSWNGAFGFLSSASVGLPTFITSNVIDIMAGETFSYIVKSDGSLWASGSSNGGSIWLNLPDTFTEEFIQLDPTQVLGACPIVGVNISNTPINEAVEVNLIIPNVFSPNGDNFNDIFYFPNEGVTEINWKIFNRWGNLIFETNELDKAWNGKTNADNDCPEGTYYYILHYKINEKEWETAKGFVSLLR